jgi:hypothetical protein
VDAAPTIVHRWRPAGLARSVPRAAARCGLGERQRDAPVRQAIHRVTAHFRTTPPADAPGMRLFLVGIGSAASTWGALAPSRRLLLAARPC